MMPAPPLQPPPSRRQRVDETDWVTLQPWDLARERCISLEAARTLIAEEKTRRYEEHRSQLSEVLLEKMKLYEARSWPSGHVRPDGMYSRWTGTYTGLRQDDPPLDADGWRCRNSVEWGWERSDFLRGLDGADPDVDILECVNDEYLRHFDMNAGCAQHATHRKVPICAFRGAEFLYSRPWAGIVPTTEPHWRKGLGTVGDCERPFLDPELLVCREFERFLVGTS